MLCKFLQNFFTACNPIFTTRGHPKSNIFKTVKTTYQKKANFMGTLIRTKLAMTNQDQTDHWSPRVYKG